MHSKLNMYYYISTIHIKTIHTIHKVYTIHIIHTTIHTTIHTPVYIYNTYNTYTHPWTLLHWQLLSQSPQTSTWQILWVHKEEKAEQQLLESVQSLCNNKVPPVLDIMFTLNLYCLPTTIVASDCNLSKPEPILVLVAKPSPIVH